MMALTDALTDALSAALLHFVWQGFAVAFLLWIALFALRNRSANARYAACCLALVVLAILPIATTAWSYEARTPYDVVKAAVVPAPAPPAAVPVLTGAVHAPWLAWARSWALTVWSIGVLFFSFRIIWGCKYIYNLKRQGCPADPAIQRKLERIAARMGVDRYVRLLLSSMADAPSVVGWLRPVVLLPASSVIGLTPEQLEAVIAHELAHVRRLDYVVSAFQVVIETLLFYHPAVWWTSSRIRHERELCCDDAVVRYCGDALCYAHALTSLEKQRVFKPSMVLGAGGSGLFYRIQRIVGVKTMEYGPSKISGVLVFALAVSGVIASMNWLRAEPQTQEAAKKIEQAIEKETAEVRLRTMEVKTGQDSPGVSVNLGAANVVHRTAIEYPRAAIEKGIQGSVSAEVTLDGSGNAVDARVLSGPTELRRSVLQSVLLWHFVAGSSQATRVIHVTFDASAAKSAGNALREPELREVNQKLEVLKKKLDEQAFMEKAFADQQKIAQADSLAIARQKREFEEAQKQNALTEEQLEKFSRAAADLAAREDEFRAAEFKVERARRPASAIGRVLKSIRLVGFGSEQLKTDLSSRLPIREGDEISKELIEKTGAAVRQFDEHLEYRFVPLEDNGSELQIIAPGGRRPPY